MIEQSAPAKVNLSLHVTGQRADRYHLLDSLVVFARIGDRLAVQPSDELSLSIGGDMAAGVPPGPENLVLRAAAMLAPGQGARIMLEKALPHAAGLGGGSADAAAALRALSRLWNLPLPPVAEILTLGADVPVCLSSAPQRMAGIGESLSAVPPVPPLYAVLVNPRVTVPTGAVFRALSCKDNPAMGAPDWHDFETFVDWLSRQRNDLQTPAIAVAPAIGTALAALQCEDARLARMSGSGATCFGLFETAKGAEAAAASLFATHPDWWVRATPLLTG
ncbi:4-(cytidine 5'-diphospho)-2-C-methyl-D-erythritol kinase [Rhodobacteraceae bacterium W635]|uniref:4-(cytidine 5'-diphospho)-2-C-methyl-D-erythritol kinase n=1 Tax=Nioella halotolerans TaxID=2303578 RepID=UPI000E3E0327|nr:4-(cytidine 5'-diphospho)-2-C-methyl-D-erythritol kinase [Rhodobacteraceae bacterium W635]